nr:MAG TPA: hypothetical protein [Caudoviricetes sp.]DAO60093.1 MAG TPA: hypothetical protein [Caudoviricetes sp.]DAV06722.1 MAG TPA: hypothetical protein [Caudoviricetes sp.]DAY55361.1 MAG TPA: hypothetical protein [Caudoviricetes sp.]
MYLIILHTSFFYIINHALKTVNKNNLKKD